MGVLQKPVYFRKNVGWKPYGYDVTRQYNHYVGDVGIRDRIGERLEAIIPLSYLVRDAIAYFNAPDLSPGRGRFDFVR